MDRRKFLKIAGMASVLPLFPETAFASAKAPLEKTLSFYNTHTGEQLKTTYWADGAYIPEAMSDINHILRDYRNGQSVQMISGYRSPQTNAQLRKNSSGVAQKSLHMQGRAIDISLPGRNLSDLRKVAISLKQGGVGYYPESNFVHVDTGRVRYW